jgi:peptidyl-prolyl cis-trans isomerase B (cyclophilin B)
VQSLSKAFVIAAALVVMGLALAACDDDSNDGDNGSNGEEACVPSSKQYDAPPEVTIDTSKRYVATIKTAKGDIIAELYTDTPVTTNNFVFLAREGYYDCLTFHRVVAEFVIQGGDPTGSGSGGPGYQIDDEDDGDHLMDTGSLSMAKSGPNTTGSQFFVVTGPRANVQHLDPDFTVFGEVTEGLEVAQQIAQGDVMESVTIEER